MMRTAVVLWASLACTACITWDPNGLRDWGDDAAAPAGWVDSRLAPALARELAEHPRFQGETLAVGLPGDWRGQPATRLEQRLEAVLESRLLHAPGLRVSASREAQCGSDAPAYRLGFVVTPVGAESRIELRVLDARAGEWVTGLADSWQGGLSPNDRDDQASAAIPTTGDGGPQSPFGTGDVDLLARALADDLSCQLVAARLLAGAVDPEPVDDRLAALVAGYLDALPHTRRGTQSWQVRIVRSPADAGLDLVIATLASDDGALTARRYVATVAPAAHRAAAQPPGAPALAEPAASREPVVASDPAPVAPELAPVGCGAHCAGVHYRGGAEASVLVALPGRGLASTRGCRRDDGAGGQRLVLVPTGSVGYASFYALSATGSSRERLAQLESRLPSACGDGGFGDTDAWVNELDRLVAEAGPELTWTTLDVQAGTLRRASR